MEWRSGGLDSVMQSVLMWCIKMCMKYLDGNTTIASWLNKTNDAKILPLRDANMGSLQRIAVDKWRGRKQRQTHCDVGIQLQQGSSDVGCQGHIVTHSSLLETEVKQQQSENKQLHA